jgi:predicted helicase
MHRLIVAGNPPYSVSSTNKGEWIQNLIADYKKNLNERKINLDDDYIKFIRYGQHFIDKNGSGILAFITNNSFIDGITHRQMRKSLMESFDKIYILDLHGNSSKKEKDPNGGSDENVFDIQQGVSINILIKSGSKNLKIYHKDVYGKRQFKYEHLADSTLNSIKWDKVTSEKPNYFFTSKDVFSNDGYLKFLSLAELFPLYNSGIQTKRDSVNIHFSKKDAENVIQDFLALTENEILKKYDLPEDGRDWKVELAKKDVKQNLLIHLEQYRPLDNRYSFYTGKSKGIVAYPRQIVSSHIIGKKNHCLCLMRQFFQDTGFSHVLYSNKMIDERTMYSNRGGTYIFPLYLYPESSGQMSLGSNETRTPNLNLEIVDQIAKGLGLSFVPEAFDSAQADRGGEVCYAESGEVMPEYRQSFAPIDLLDYIYAVLHSPTYRETYKEFLKIDFPRVPYPTDADTFWKLVALGGELRQLHLMESPTLSQFITQYPVGGENEVEKIRFENLSGLEDLTGLATGRVYINSDQYFDSVPEVAWNFYIGGYQPAQKWLKDRKGRILDFEDIMHYQKIIKALAETDRVMGEIDGVNFMEGGEG